MAFYKYYPNRENAVRVLRDVDSVNNEIFANGPVTAGMQVWDDLYLFNGNGIYAPGPNANKAERHSVILLGFGSDYGRSYFIVQNSWGKSWGNNGYFKMYTDVCEIMGLVVAGDVQ